MVNRTTVGDYSYPDEVARKWASDLDVVTKERDAAIKALELLMQAKKEKLEHGDNPVYQALKSIAWAEVEAVLKGVRHG